MTRSIRQRLLVTLLSVVILSWVLTALSGYYEAHHEIEELFDAQLAQSARVLLAMSSHELEEERLYGQSGNNVITAYEAELAAGHEYERKLAFQVWTEGNKLALRSENAPTFPMAGEANGYSERTLNETHWRVYSLTGAHGKIRVQVAQSLEIRNELVEAIAQRLLIPILLSLPLLALLIWFGVTRALRPLLDLARDVSQRDPDQLQPLPLEHIPAESRPLVESLNQLFDRLETAFENERRFTADAAHELRTPLAALRIQAQVAQGSEDETARRHALQQLVQGVDRATHLVQQLLTLARLDPDTAYVDKREVDLCTLARETLAELSAAAQAKNIEMSLDPACHGRVRGNHDALAILLRNLVENAIRYTPEGGTVEVRVQTREDQGVELSVADSGPGIPEEERPQVMERFYRSSTAQQTPGSGLGLSIVQRVVEHHKATLTLGSSTLGGLEVTVRFPKP
ncbi:MAG TPA: two-component sensor histidine kinase [Gammaproteobacteria bacterium]|nr:two-component sensor histidine kinase [Gammaproteobacteria bacterium]